MYFSNLSHFITIIYIFCYNFYIFYNHISFSPINWQIKTNKSNISNSMRKFWYFKFSFIVKFDN